MKINVSKVLKFRTSVQVVHHIPGRIRLRYKPGMVAILARYNKSEIETFLNSITAFKSYQLNTQTGSILIEYDPCEVEPSLIEQLFFEQEEVVRQACSALAERLNLEGVYE